MKHIGRPIQSVKQVEAIQHFLLQSSKRDALLFLFAIHSCLKVSELLQLQVGDVLNKKGEIRHSILFYNEKIKIHKWFAVNKNLHLAIKHYICERKNWTYEEPLFKSQKGLKTITRQHAWYILDRAARAAGLEGISSHTLQKTWGYHAYRAGVDIALLQHFFEHNSPATTLKYIGLTRNNS